MNNVANYFNALWLYWHYIVAFLVPPKYVWNVLVGAFWFARAVANTYRPNSYGYVHSVFYALDCLANAVALGDPKETISSRAAKARAAGRLWGCKLCAFLGWCATLILRKPTDHCAQSVLPNAGANAILPDGE